MSLVTWTAVFRQPSIRDSREQVAAAINGLIGARLQQELRPLLRRRGWHFEEAVAEDHGWHALARVQDEGKALTANLVTAPELDEATPDGGARDGAWRVVIGLDLGLFAGTKARRTALFRRLAADLDASCRELGASNMQWEVGGP